MKLVGISDRDTAIALRLVGIQETYLPDKDAVNIWNKIIEQTETAIFEGKEWNLKMLIFRC